mgnify:CR=1 FL=1
MGSSYHPFPHTHAHAHPDWSWYSRRTSGSHSSPVAAHSPYLPSPSHLCTSDAAVLPQSTFASIQSSERKNRCVLFFSCLPRSLVRWLPRSPAAAGGRCDANLVHPIGRRRLHRLRPSELKLEKKRGPLFPFTKLTFTKSRCTRASLPLPFQTDLSLQHRPPTVALFPTRTLVGNQPHHTQRRKGRWRV